MEMNCASYLKLSVSVQAQLWMPLSALRPVIGLSLERTVCSAPAGGGGGFTPCGARSPTVPPSSFCSLSGPPDSFPRLENERDNDSVYLTGCCKD